MRRFRFGRLVLMLCCLAALAAGARGAEPPRAVASDVSYGTHPHQLLDVYVPGNGAGPFPVVIWFGKIWEPGKIVPPVQRFLPTGCAVVAVETRVMKDGIAEGMKAPVAACMLDACRSVQFTRLNAAKWKLDPNRIAVVGSSQGSLLALYVACAGEQAKPDAADPVDRVSTRVSCVVAHRSQPSIDPQRMQEWVPGVEWGAPALGCSFAESLKRRDELLPLIKQWSPDALVSKDAPPIYFEYNWGLTQPAGVKDADYRVHSPRWALGFQKVAQDRGATCYVKFPDHPSENYADMWDFLLQQLSANAGSERH